MMNKAMHQQTFAYVDFMFVANPKFLTFLLSKNLRKCCIPLFQVTLTKLLKGQLSSSSKAWKMLKISFCRRLITQKEFKSGLIPGQAGTTKISIGTGNYFISVGSVFHFAIRLHKNFNNIIKVFYPWYQIFQLCLVPDRKYDQDFLT